MVRTYPHFNPFSVIDPVNINWRDYFPDQVLQPLNLEIGCSNGRWLLDFARKYPQKIIVGVETRNKYVQTLEVRIKESGLLNVAVIRANINTALLKLFQKEQLGDVFIMFPDPWYKKKHLKRRVVQPEFLDQIYLLMQTGCRIHVATDKQEFALEILQLLMESKFVNCYTGFAPENIPGLVTEIESFHLHNNNQIYRMVFQK